MFSELHRLGIGTVMDRVKTQGAQCRVGQLGLCCRFCLQGPCRINAMGKEPTTGICGARDYTMVARFIDRMIAGGTASHAGHGKEIAHVLHAVAKGEVLTGLLYVKPDAEDLHAHLNTYEVPFNKLGEKELCPGAAMLERINAALR